MAKIDLMFLKGNRTTAKKMGSTYKPKRTRKK